VKHLCIATSTTEVLYASRYYPGIMHDKTMLVEESQKEKLSSKIKKLFDLAFIGIETDYPDAVLPNKKPKGKELTKRQKQQNRKISRIRVKVENSFAGVKRLRIVYNVCRIKRDDFIDLVFDVSCGIWNYYLVNSM
jgi:hypothetical protein